MASKTLFASRRGRLVPRADAINEAGGAAYQFGLEHALAQLAATGCLNTTYYASATGQLDKALALCEGVEPEFIAKTAVYARRVGYMKDMPALLCAVLAARGEGGLLRRAFTAIDNGRMLRNFVQIIRSGVTGRKSLGTLPRRLVREWLAARTDDQIFRDSVGNDPSLADIIKMVHPRPATAPREALYGYLIDRQRVNAEALPLLVRQYEAFKARPGHNAPDVPFQMLTGLPLEPAHWRSIARDAQWHMTRMNLNTFARHGVFEDAELTVAIADRLRDPELITKARVFPYQLLVAYVMIGDDIPHAVREALQDAMELATKNVPAIDGRVVVCPDVSGSMSSPVTGYREGATSAVSCIDIAALVAATVLRTNPATTVLPFECDVVDVQLNPRDSVMTTARLLASIGGGGTNCSAPLAKLNREGQSADLVIFISDNESWIDYNPWYGTSTMDEWSRFKVRNPGARMVALDIQPNDTTQAQERDDVLNIGGFSDRVFEVIGEFAAGRLAPSHWVGQIEAIEI